MDTHGIRARGRGWRFIAWALLSAACVLGAAGAARAQEPAAVLLDPARPDVVVASVLGWYGRQPRNGIDAAVNGRLPFTPYSLHQTVRFHEGESLWLKLRLQAVRGSDANWQLEVPVPVVDVVTVYQRDAAGRWSARSAGDLVPLREWPQAGRYPFFALQVPQDAPAEIYLEVRHTTPLTLPLRLMTSSAHYQRMQVEYLALGLFMGALGLMVLASLLRSLLLRDSAYAWFAAYALVSTLAVASFTGVAGHLLWGNSGTWVDAAPGALPLLGGSLGLVIVARLSGAVTRIRWLRRSLNLFALAGVALAVLFPFVDRATGLMLLGAHLAGVTFLTLYAATLTWRRDDAVGLWMLLGAIPLTLTVVVALARATGLLPWSWLSEYALVLALTVNLPMVFGALNSRSQERRSVELRRLASSSQDALTGLLKREPFIARLRQALARYERRGEGAAIAVIEVVNHEWIQKTRGAEAAEEALLRTVIKLRRLVRDVDTTGRLGENRFGLILEGVGMRRPMNTVATRLVASGLMEEPDAPRDTVLHFHVAAVVLSEHRAKAEELLDQLCGVLDTMSPRTRRPLRFLEPGGAASVPDSGGAHDHPGTASPAVA